MQSAPGGVGCYNSVALADLLDLYAAGGQRGIARTKRTVGKDRTAAPPVRDNQPDLLVSCRHSSGMPALRKPAK